MNYIFYLGIITVILPKTNIEMACSSTDNFRLQSGGEQEISVSNNSELINVCTATRILDRLHKDFTEQYVNSATTGKTAIADTHKNNPTFYLRKQPTLAAFNNETAGGSIDRFYKYFTENKPDDQIYRSAIHAIMTGNYSPSINQAEYLSGSTPEQDDFSSPSNFKGIYGLINVNKILETNINNKIKGLSTTSDGSNLVNYEQHYEQRQGIKTTLEEIARRENEIYREKFFNIVLIIVGIFIVASQLVKRYFSFGSGGASGSGGGGVFGNLFTGFGLGASSGLFSRFGGIGLGRSGRSRITGIFSNSPYSLSNR
jgi:hypothetical protein